ncbi:MAG: AAC(3) family N-acetyltransferase [Victivallales bacterium]|nr:AAC(3) family N-acetyltransferase [Victivallales bacterium]
MKKNDIVKGLRELGLKKNDIVLLHSSFRSLGDFDGDADDVIDAFMTVLGPKGAFIVPVFGSLGILPDRVKARKDAFVSEAPVGTLAGIGGRAKDVLSGHWEAETAHGEGSPFLKIAKAGGYVCLLGVDQDRNTTLHSVEAILKLPYLGSHTEKCKAPDGKEVTRTWHYYPGPHRDFIGLDHIMRDNGIMSIIRIGDAQVRLIKMKEMLELMVELGDEDSAFALCDNPACADCVRQRAAIFADRIANETFKLSASSRLCGRYVPEMIEKLQAIGIKNVELDYVQGKACAFMDAGQLKRIIEDFQMARISISALRSYVVPENIASFVQKMKDAGISRVILPLTESFDGAGEFEKEGIVVDYVNTHVTAVQAAKTLATVAPKRRAFVFNPSGFVLAGQMPFLNAWKNGQFTKTIAQLDINDRTWDGEIRTLATGNGEIKELISILRCRCFSGWMTLGGGAPYPGDLEAAVKDFVNLICTM